MLRLWDIPILKMSNAPLIALILAGGESKRMGKSKAWLEYHGEPQVIWLYQQLKSIVGSALISINQWPENQIPLPCITDLPSYQNHGPISGILSAFELHHAPMLVMGCDYPLLNRQHLTALIEQRELSADATVCSNSEGYFEPLFGIYEVSGLIKLKQHFESGNNSISAFLRKSIVHPLKDIPEMVMRSVDTEEGYKAVVKMMAKG